ncbi:sporulation inhibitor of replication protein SirA [Bacillus salitolerans]|uniref:Sporulation inhibitor of replication protein SirA n=1 Tax=Bacillus salitolerans TaxID=1437434 RepID=A0ABW4LPE9_9BACI
MRQYQIYWVEEEFANHYFGREIMFYRLFFQFNEERNEERKNILNKQVEYITKPLPAIQLNQFIESELKGNINFTITTEGFMFHDQATRSGASLSVHERYIWVVGTGNYETEMMLFDLLRKWDSRFLAIDLGQARYGWLSPIKQRKFV